MFGRDLAHTGAADVPGSEPRGIIKWAFATGGPIHSSPAVAGGIVYFGSQDSTLYALDSATGSLIWQFHAESLIRTSPAVVDGVLYFGAHDGSIRALDAATGEQLWSYREEYAITSSPAVADGLVYVGTTAKRLLALDAATGKRKWSAPLVGQVHSSPAVANGLVYVGTLGEFFYIVHARDGRVRTWFRARRDVASSPAVAGTSVYFTTTAGRLHAIDGTRRGLPLEHRIRPLLLRMRAIGLPVPRLRRADGPPVGTGYRHPLGLLAAACRRYAVRRRGRQPGGHRPGYARGAVALSHPRSGKLFAAAGGRPRAGGQRGWTPVRGARRNRRGALAGPHRGQGHFLSRLCQRNGICRLTRRHAVRL